jgi:Kinetochore complex Sim4 subunit Fta1
MLGSFLLVLELSALLPTRATSHCGTDAKPAAGASARRAQLSATTSKQTRQQQCRQPTWLPDSLITQPVSHPSASTPSRELLTVTENAMTAYPLYDSTFTLYRVSPLYHGTSSVLDNLDLHARRLRDNLTGDTFRSFQPAEGNTFASSSGSFQSCTWDLLGDEASWDRAHRQQDEDEDEISVVGTVMTPEAKGVHVQVEYEKAKHSAVLLGDAARKSTTPGFTSLPLLLVRMPVALRQTFLDYLTTAFDTRITPMKLRSGFLSSTLEKLLNREASSQFLDSGALVKGLQLQLLFPSATPLLKSLDISLSKDNVQEFLARGDGLYREYRRRIAALDSALQPQHPLQGPFSAALSAYLNQHATLTLDHPGILLSKVVCGPFALSGEGKLKIMDSSDAAIVFWGSLVKEAEGAGLSSKKIHHPLNPMKETAPRGPRSPTGPPPPYELHDPAPRRR